MDHLSAPRGMAWSPCLRFSSNRISRGNAYAWSVNKSCDTQQECRGTHSRARCDYWKPVSANSMPWRWEPRGGPHVVKLLADSRTEDDFPSILSSSRVIYKSLSGQQHYCANRPANRANRETTQFIFKHLLLECNTKFDTTYLRGLWEIILRN